MNLPKAIVESHFTDYLEGKEVRARIRNSPQIKITPGTHVMAFKDTIASKVDLPVPKSQQSHYIGVEGKVLQVLPILPDNSNKQDLEILIVKL